ncbi:metallophosphoesterase [Tardiphaga sp. vice154]|uniref:metallophosphoesterase family protein n=1 Tax=Tardiphaga sp. vice154 TaxID=2592814 RepID=UPI0011659D45|nr:metallophosphoesterase [Tardiphaga sp. vice154]QDM24647.1 metallophosphoesterase [Tardiphaga sp. vice154]
MTAFTLAHLSDVHLPPLPQPAIGELLGKRMLGYINWKRNRHRIHQSDVLDALVADIKAQAPDHIAVTGDLVNLAHAAEFAPARQWIEGVGAPQLVSLVPGNHDAYTRNAVPRFEKTFGDYMRSDTGAVGFPYLQRRGPLALIGLSTAVPTAPFMATGTLGAAQLATLDRMLGEVSGAELFRVLMIHHPLRSKHKHKRLTDSDALQMVLKRHGVELILHGHDHIHSTMWFEGPSCRIPAIGVPSASAIAHGHRPAAAYNLFAIERAGDAWRCEQTVRGFGDGTGIQQLQRAALT